MLGVNDRVSVCSVPEERVAHAVCVATAAAGVPIEVAGVVGLEIVYIYIRRACNDNACDRQKWDTSWGNKQLTNVRHDATCSVCSQGLGHIIGKAV